jgi:hypothetical protein
VLSLLAPRLLPAPGNQTWWHVVSWVKT